MKQQGLRQKKDRKRRRMRRLLRLLHFTFRCVLKSLHLPSLPLLPLLPPLACVCLSAQYDKSFDQKRKNEAKKNPFFFFFFSSDPKIYFLYLAPRWPRAHFEARGSTCQKIASFLFSRVRSIHKNWGKTEAARSADSRNGF